MLRMKKYARFQKAQHTLRVIDQASAEWKDIDCCIIGSDTVWNFNDSHFRNHIDKYIGIPFSDKKTITYAVSAGDTPISYFENNSTIRNGMLKLWAISVRDQKTQEIVSKITSEVPAIVLDPTVLLDVSDYQKLEKKINCQEYILIYCFETITQKQKNELIRLKEREGLKIVSFSSLRNWTDISVNADPYTFLSYFHHAKYVVTDTFHGTIFSIIYKKDFVVITNEKNKINDFLGRLCLEERIVPDAEKLIDALHRTVSYEQSDSLIEEMKEESFAFLRKCLNE